MFAANLECDLNIFIGKKQHNDSSYLNKIWMVSFVAGIFYLINFILNFRFIYGHIALTRVLIYSIINVFTGVLFFYGFYELGKHYSGKLLQIASMIFIICIPIFNITDLISKASVFHPGIYLNKLCVAVLGINDILFGIGLLKTGSRFAALYKIAGILQILTGPFIIIPLGLTQLIGLWLIIPSDLLLIIIIFFEYRESGRINPTVLTS